MTSNNSAALALHCVTPVKAGVQCSLVLFLALLLATLPHLATAEPCATLQGSAPTAPLNLHCGNTPSAAFDTDGRLWVAFEQAGHVYVSHSDDQGASYSTPVQANSEPEDIEHNGEGRPKLKVSANGTLLLSWTMRTSPNFTGDIRFTRSTDGGASFDPVRTINDDGLLTGHRFDELFLTPSGHLFLTWIDKRDMEAATAQQQAYPGAAIYYAVSTDDGATFSTNHAVSQNSCECCRIAMAPYGEDKVAIFFRQIYGNDVRDHAMAVLDGEGHTTVLQRATIDDWHINACPHHGPAISATSEPGSYDLAWFSGGLLQSGVLYGRHDLAGGHTTQTLQVDANPGAGHPALGRHGGTLYLVWKSFDGSATGLQLRKSTDDGHSWSEPQTLLRTSAASDHPLLVTGPGGLYLGWATTEYGYLFRELSNAAD